MRWMAAVLVVAAWNGNPTGADGGDDGVGGGGGGEGGGGGGGGGTADGGMDPSGETDGGVGGSTTTPPAVPQMLAQDCQEIERMTTDATHLYWARNPGTNIRRM